MAKTSRREFLKSTGVGAAALGFSLPFSAASGPDRSQEDSSEFPFKLGMASYTFREFGLDETLQMTKRLGLEHICFKSFHLPLESTPVEIEAIAKKTRDAGLDLYGCGVVYMTTAEEVNVAFAYARAASMRTIVGVPNFELLELVETKVREFDIRVAIHNHGPGDDLYPTPESVYEKIKNRDPRIGLCLDIGHTQRSGVNPSSSALQYADRLLDVHIKDVTAPTEAGQALEIGRGVIDIPQFLKTLIKMQYSGFVSFEYEKDGRDPLPGAAESVGYVRGVLAAL